LEERPGPKEEEELPRGRGRVLVVDDEEVVLDVARDMLEYLGYEVELAGSGKEAINRFKVERGFDLVVLDIIMPEMSGKEVFKEIRRLAPEQKVLFASGYSMNGLMREIEDPNISFVQKPFNFHELARMVKKMVGDR
jgi:CheY-like chemotaxis protein